MEKRYQVFVSSTFEDLKEERNAVSKAILDLGHIPSGMEMFPASPKSQLDYIKKIIDNCDYYVLILGGRYGSLDEDGLSYTEKEFDYAVSIKVPILAFVHEDTGDLKSRNVETDPDRREALENFRRRVLSERIVKMWRDLNDLQSSVIVSLTSEFSDNPRTGWRRDDGSMTAEAKAKIKRTEEMGEYWRKRSNAFEEKLKEYEGLEKSEIELRYIGENGASSITVKAGALVKEFASDCKQVLEEAT